MTCTYVIGDARDVLAAMPDNSVDLVMSSPPFLALRSYLPTDHVDKHREIGSEPTPADFLATLLDLAVECRRVLAPHGTLAFELGDTYAGSGGAGGDYKPGGLREGEGKADGSSKRMRNQRNDKIEMATMGILGTTSGQRHKANPGSWPLSKSLTGIPTLFAWSLAYGRNLLRPEQTFEPWRIRNVLVWARANPPVGALGDKFRPATSYITIACPSATRWFDLDAVRGSASENTHARTAKGVTSRKTTGKAAADERRGGNFSTLDTLHQTRDAPPLDWWSDIDDGPNGDRLWWLNAQPYSGSHYAVFPAELPRRIIEAMCPREVCTRCGTPRRRIAETTNAVGTAMGRRAWRESPEGKHTGDITRSSSSAPSSIRKTLGWTDCGCRAPWRHGHVLDPFGGSGTTGAVATGCGRNATLIDIDERNIHLARERIGMFLEEPVPALSRTPKVRNG